MRAFIAAVLVAIILAMTAGAVLDSFLQQRSTDAYTHPSARV